MTVEEQYFYLINHYSYSLNNLHSTLSLEEIRSFLGYEFLIKRRKWNKKVNKRYLQKWARGITIDYLRKHQITRYGRDKTFDSLEGLEEHTQLLKHDEIDNDWTFWNKDFNQTSPRETLEYKDDIETIKEAIKEYSKRYGHQKHSIEKRISIIQDRSKGAKIADLAKKYKTHETKIVSLTKETIHRLKILINNDADHLGNLVYEGSNKI